MFPSSGSTSGPLPQFASRTITQLRRLRETRERVQVPKPQNRSRPDAPRPPNSQKLELPLTLNLPSASPGRRPTWQSKQAPHHKPSPFAHPSGTLPPCHAPTTMYYVCTPCLPRLCETAPFPRQAASQGEEREREKDSEPCSARYRAFVRAKKSHVRWLNPSGGLLCYVSRVGIGIWGALCSSPWLGGHG